jgi:organic hydroperoxide reductase OsmC/OhrA
MRYYRHTINVLLILVAAHIACFSATFELIRQEVHYVHEVDNAGKAMVAMHRIAIKTRFVYACMMLRATD